ncbi:MAG: hypothetical protein CMB80_08130 [Flammeovirgaceae bacterium]|nr:hypothetical protein [Flammeovirgaceae bacterium]
MVDIAWAVVLLCIILGTSLIATVRYIYKFTTTGDIEGIGPYIWSGLLITSFTALAIIKDYILKSM